MKCFHLLLFAEILTSSCCGANAEEDAFFQFLNPDASLSSSTAPEINSPTKANTVLEKWRNYERTQTESHNKNLQSARSVAVEMLLKKSLTAPPEGRAKLLAEAERIKALPIEKPLIQTDGQPADKLNSLLGKWDCPSPKGHHIFELERETEIYGWKGSAGWRWVDGAAGVLVTGNSDEYGNVFWMQKPNHIMAINSKYVRSTLQKARDSVPMPLDPITVNLSKSESDQLATLNVQLNTKRQRVIKWLLEKAKTMSATETSEVVANVSKMEQEADEITGNASKLSGVWRWEQMDLVFQPRGIVAQRDGRVVGRWGLADWGSEKICRSPQRRQDSRQYFYGRYTDFGEGERRVGPPTQCR